MTTTAQGTATGERQRLSARRESLLGDEPGAFASARFVRITPQKARRVVDMVRGLGVDDVIVHDQRPDRLAAVAPLLGVLESATGIRTTLTCVAPAPG